LSQESYQLDESFECLVGVLCATSPKFLARIGHALDPEGLLVPGVRLLVQASQQISRDLGRGPSDAAVVVQRIRRLVDDGKVTFKELQSAIDVLVDVDPATAALKADEVIVELKEILKRRMQQNAVRVAMEEYQKKGDFQQVVRMLSKANALGAQEAGTGVRLGPQSFEVIRAMRHLDRMPWGIPELDTALNGGLPRGCLAAVMARSGGGKSMTLSHTCAGMLRQSCFTVYASLELPAHEIMARVKANITGIPITKVLYDEEEAEELIHEMLPTLGTFIVKSFPAGITTVNDLREWVKEIEQEEGMAIDVLAVDYLDKLGSTNRNDRNAYEVQGRAAEELRLFIADTGKWGITACQPRRAAGKEKERRLDMDDVADSLNKPRVLDQFITANKTPSGEEFEWFVAKNRYGQSEMLVGPLPHDMACGRMVVM
jgi:replicative DNA helicase